MLTIGAIKNNIVYLRISELLLTMLNKFLLMRSQTCIKYIGVKVFYYPLIRYTSWHDTGSFLIMQQKFFIDMEAATFWKASQGM